MRCRTRCRTSAPAVPARSPALPDIPTMSETIPGYEVRTWSGVGAPAGTPAEVIERLNREINAGLADPGIAARFAEVGAMPTRFTVDEMRAMIARDVAKWAKVVKVAGIKTD